MRGLFFTILTLLLVLPNEYTLLKKVEKQADFLTTDNLGDSYLIKSHEVFKYLPDGSLQYTFSNLSYGNISFVDATNPLKILVFYKDFSRIIFLDNTLSESKLPITLQDLGLEQASAVCTSFDNGLWVYDPVNFQMLRFDQDLKVTQDVKNVQQLTRETIQPDFMVESGNWLYLNDPESGIFVFDLFGTFFKKIPLLGLHSFQVFGEDIFYFKEGKLKSYHLRKMEEHEYPLPEANCIAARMEKERLMLQKEKELLIYKVK